MTPGSSGQAGRCRRLEVLLFSRSSRRRWMVISVTTASTALALASLVAVGPAAGDDSDAGLAPIGVLVPDDELDPRILALDFDGAAYRRAVEHLEATMYASEQTRRDHERAVADARALGERARRIVSELGHHREVATSVAAEIAVIEAVIAERAVERFVRHGADIDARLDPTDSVDETRGAVLAAEVDDVQLVRRAELLAAAEASAARTRALEAEAILVDLSRSATIERRERLQLALTLGREDIEAAQRTVAAARRSARVPRSDMSVVALDAYLDAESVLTATDPGCGIRWWMVAGVARVESRHGEIGGRSLRADGRVDDPIVGVALDGGPRVQLVLDTDDGRLDSDVEFDRAVGPLQFIPETWNRLGRDANGDGRTDPQDMYDAAVTAATYLCRLGGDLRTEAGLRSAYFGYNASASYVDAVHGHARRYAEIVPDSGPSAP